VELAICTTVHNAKHRLSLIV